MILSKPIQILIGSVLLFSWAFATTYPYSSTDDLGNALSLLSEPMRIVSMVPSHSETLCALGACDKLVGVDPYSNFPASLQDLSQVGSVFAPNIEAIVALEPDLVLINENSALAEQLISLGLKVYAGSAQSYEDAFASFTVLGALVNREIEAILLSREVQDKIAEVDALVEGLEPKSLYLEIDATPYSVGPNSFMGVLLAKAGANNIVSAELGDFPQLDPEYIVLANPEVIILADAPYGESAQSVAARAGWEAISAVQTGNIIELSEAEVDMTNRPGPRMGEAIAFFATLIHGVK